MHLEESASVMVNLVSPSSLLIARTAVLGVTATQQRPNCSQSEDDIGFDTVCGARDNMYLATPFHFLGREKRNSLPSPAWRLVAAPSRE